MNTLNAQALQSLPRDEMEESNRIDTGADTSVMMDSQTHHRPTTSDAGMISIRTASLDAEKIASFEEQVKLLQEQLGDSERSRKVQAKSFEQAQKAAEKNHSQILQQELRKVEDDRLQILAKHAQLEKELELEIQLSKQLQASQPQGPHHQSMPSSSTNTTVSSSNPNNGMLQRQLESEQSTTKLILELVGMELLHQNTNTSTSSTTYSLLMSDTKRRRHLHFRLITHPNADAPNDSTIDFLPDFQEGRDDDVQKYLDESLRGRINFKWELLPVFFRRVSRNLVLAGTIR